MQQATILTDIAIGEIIRQRRRELGLTQEELAERIEVTSQQMQRYEYGKTKLKVENLQAIAKALDVPVSYFFGEHGNEPKPSTFQLTPTELKIVSQFRKIENAEVRELVVNLLRQAVAEKT